MAEKFEFPALYDTASDLSSGSQKRYLNLIRVEYVLLVLSAVLSMDFSDKPSYFAVYAFIFVLLLGVSIVRSWQKPEQDWYKGRALAESIKTSCWRYCMRAEPFGDADKLSVRRAEFRSHLLSILEANRHIGDRLPPDSAANEQITSTMEATRAFALDERKAFYKEFRIKDQRLWYAKKASFNKKASKFWVGCSVSAYLIAILLTIFRIVYPEIKLWPIEPIIVIASSIIGWTQVKKFNELASSYTLTAHEIGIIQGRVSEIDSEGEFSIFINEAEQAFSREHTQWVARQQSS